MVHKRGLGSLPKGLEWIEPQLSEESKQESKNEHPEVSVERATQTVATAKPNLALLEESEELKSIHKNSLETPTTSCLKGLKAGWTRATFIVREEQAEKLKAVAYWERITVKEVLEEALALYLENKNIRKIPTRSRS